MSSGRAESNIPGMCFSCEVQATQGGDNISKSTSALRGAQLAHLRYLHKERTYLDKVVSCSCTWLASEQRAAHAVTKRARGLHEAEMGHRM